MIVSFRNRLVVTVATAALVVAATRGQTPPQQPVFKSGVELVTIDVQVVDKKGTPIPALRPDQFEVSIDGKRRQIVSAQLVDAATGVAEAMTGGAGETPGAKPIQPGNVYVLLVDQGVEPQEADRDGKSHLIRVKVNQSGSSVRNRPTVVIPKRGT